MKSNGVTLFWLQTEKNVRLCNEYFLYKIMLFSGFRYSSVFGVGWQYSENSL